MTRKDMATLKQVNLYARSQQAVSHPTQVKTRPETMKLRELNPGPGPIGNEGVSVKVSRYSRRYGVIKITTMK